MKDRMLNRNIHKYGVLITFLIVITLHSCAPADGEFQGNEFMPDMKHSIAYEANYYNYYSLNTWGTEEEYHNFATPRKPVDKTIPRGYAGLSSEDLMHGEEKEISGGQPITFSGYVPYYYGDSEEERTRASNEITKNPFPITEKSLNIGKELYDINCGICHGPKGDGLGYLVRDDGGLYPAQPANLLMDTFINAAPGQFYHSIMYGKNMMGSYKDKLSYKERWDVIHYIRSLQAKEKKLAYSPDENTLNDFAIPVTQVTGRDIEPEDTSKIEVNMPDQNKKGMQQNDSEAPPGESQNDELH